MLGAQEKVASVGGFFVSSQPSLCENAVIDILTL